LYFPLGPRDYFIGLIDDKMKYISPVIACICLTVIELYALSKNIDGTVLTFTVAAISGIAGYEIRNIRTEKRR